MNIKIQCTFLVLLLSMPLFSQKIIKKEADKEYGNKKYASSIETNLRLAENGNKEKEVLGKLANAYYFIDDYENAAKWYHELFEIYKIDDPEYYFKYSDCLKSVGKFAESKEMAQKFISMSPSDPRAHLLLKNTDYLNQIALNSNRYKIDTVGINTKYSEFGQTFYKKTRVFSSSRFNGVKTKSNSNWDNNPYYSMYCIRQYPDKKDMPPVLMKFKRKRNAAFIFKGSWIKSNLDETSPIFTADGKKMYFTRSVPVKRTKKDTVKSQSVLKIFMSELVVNKKQKPADTTIIVPTEKQLKANPKFNPYKKFKPNEEVWGEPKELSINGNDFNTAHAVLNKEENIMYFASDRPGGFGGSDLYSVTISPDGVFGTPENLGAGINTKGRESFPFLSDNGELYFSSDSHAGLGGFDVFVSKEKAGGKFIAPQNLGTPINSSADDFAYTINATSPTTDKGFFASNIMMGFESDTKSSNKAFFNSNIMMGFGSDSKEINTGNNKGFFASNRKNGKGSDDIYTFTEEIKLPLFWLKKSIVDATNETGLENVKVSLLYNGILVDNIETDNQGLFVLKIPDAKEYSLKLEKDKYISRTVSLQEARDVEIKGIRLKKYEEAVTVYDIINGLAVPDTTKKTVLANAVSLSEMNASPVAKSDKKASSVKKKVPKKANKKKSNKKKVSTKKATGKKAGVKKASPKKIAKKKK